MTEAIRGGRPDLRRRRGRPDAGDRSRAAGRRFPADREDDAAVPRLARQGHPAAHARRCSRISASSTAWLRPAAPTRRSANTATTAASSSPRSWSIGDPTPAEPYRIPLMLPQFLTEGVMRERLAELGQRVQFGCELDRASTQDEDGVTARLSAGPARRRCACAISSAATAGAASCVTRWMSAFPARRWACAPMVADVVLDGAEPRRVASLQRRRDGVQMALCPLAGHRAVPAPGADPARRRGRSVGRRPRGDDRRAHRAQRHSGARRCRGRRPIR